MLVTMMPLDSASAISGSKAVSPGWPMMAMPSGLVATAWVNWVVILAGSQSDHRYSTCAPVPVAAATAPLYTTVSKPPPADPPGKKTILVLEHQLVPAAGAPPSVAAGAEVAGAVVGATVAGLQATSRSEIRAITEMIRETFLNIQAS